MQNRYSEITQREGYAFDTQTEQITKFALAMQDTSTFYYLYLKECSMQVLQSPLHARIQHLGSVQYDADISLKQNPPRRVLRAAKRPVSALLSPLLVSF